MNTMTDFAMTQQELDKLDRDFSRTKVKLFSKKTCSGLLGTILCKLQFEWSREIPTACISTEKLMWNPDFYQSLDEESRVTVLAHEMYHNVRLHSLRMGNRCPEIWNIAGDYVINNDLKKHGFYMGGFPYLLEPKYDGWSTEQVYADLIAPGGPPLPQQGSLPLMGDIVPFEGTGDEKEKAMARAMANVIFASNVAKQAKQAGSIPGETELLIEEFLNPVLPWNQILYNFFNEFSNQEYSYARPNRRYEDPLLRGLSGRDGLEHLVYCLDVSGSISDQDILRFNSEVKWIKDELQPEMLTLITFDTRIRNTYVFEKDDPFEKIIVTGRGGTDLREVFDFIKTETPTAVVIFTDLWVDIPEDPKIPIIWAVTGNPNAEVPFGQLIHVPAEEEQIQ